MTIELQTGLPGACKTLYTLDRVEALRRKTGRPVFYSGIPIDKTALPDWTEIKADEWYTAPPEAIVILDEAQKLFRPRASGSQVPKYESELETHRHGGIDLILITQSPRLVSIGVRELVGRHLHAVRVWGFQRSTIHEWGECRLNIQARKDSSKTTYSFNRKVYTWYKSSEAHTVQPALPFRVKMLIALVFGLPLLVGYMAWRFTHQVEDAKHAPGAPGQPSAAAAGGKPGDKGRALSPAEYLATFQPRVAGLDYTAPVYDKVTTPVRAPMPAACVASKARCTCYSQQATRLEVPDSLCRSIVAGGFFVAWDEQRRESQAQPLPPAARGEPLQGGEPSDGWSSFGGEVKPQITAERVSVATGGRPGRSGQ